MNIDWMIQDLNGFLLARQKEVIFKTWLIYGHGVRYLEVIRNNKFDSDK